MKLNNNKNVILCTKALYAEQLKCYATLCECYEALANTLGKNATAEDVQKRYAPYLSLASKGDLSFLDKENNYIFSQEYLGARFQNSEAKIFREYAKQTQRLSLFKEGAAILSQSLSKDGVPYQEDIEDYKTYMKKASPITRKFDKEISEHSPTYIGHLYYLTSRRAISDIRHIDPSHLDGIPVSMEMAPHQFGANISGYTTMDKIMETTRQDARDIDTREERSEYAQKVNPIREHGYRFFAKNQRGLALSLAAIMALGLTTGVANGIKTAHEYNSLSIDTLSEKGYKSDLSAETIHSIENIEQLVNDAQSQNTIPTEDQLRSLGNTIDDLFDDILEEKIAPSFLEAHPEAKDISVDHYYNYTNPEDPYKAIIISYTDKEGKEQEERITHFGSVGAFTPNDVSNVFEHEYATDSSYSEINSIFSGSGNYIDTGKDVQDVLKGYSNSIDFMKHLAALDLNYKDGTLLGIIPASIKADFPEKTDSSRNLDDGDER